MKYKDLKAMSERIKSKRKSMGKTQEKIAEMLNISYSSYVKIENGLQRPSLNTLIDIAVLMNVSLDELVFGFTESLDVDSPQTSALLHTLKFCDKEKLAYAADMLESIVSCLK